MLYILHGDNTVSARNRLLEILSSYKNTAALEADKISSIELSQNMLSSDLFSDKKCVVIEKIGKLPKKELEFLEKILKEHKNLPDIIFLNSSELSKIFLSKFKDAKVESFMFPKLFFLFLDSLVPQNFLKELEILLKMENVEAEQIFYSMIKRIRLILMVKSQAETEELLKMSPWQKDKIISQTRLWKEEELLYFYKKLLEIEKKIKSSALPVSLKKQLDFLFSSELH